MEYGDVLDPVAEEPNVDRMDATYRAIVDVCDRWRVDDETVERVEDQLNLPRRMRRRATRIGSTIGIRMYGEDEERAVQDAGFLAEIALTGVGMTAASYAFDRIGTGLAWYGAGWYRDATEGWADTAEESLIRYADYVRGDEGTDAFVEGLEEHPFETATRAILWDCTASFLGDGA